MAITLVAVSTAAAPNSTSVVVPKPTGTAQNDQLIGVAVCDHSDPINTPSGWTLVAPTTASGDGQMKVFRRTAGASESSDYTFEGWVTEDAVGWIAAYRGVSTGSPIDVFGSTFANSSSPVCTAITTTVDGCKLVGIVGGGDGRLHVFSPPSSYTERVDITTGNSFSDACGTMADFDQASAGDSGTQSFTPEDGPYNWFSVHLALAPSNPSGNGALDSAVSSISGSGLVSGGGSTGEAGNGSLVSQSVSVSGGGISKSLGSGGLSSLQSQVSGSGTNGVTAPVSRLKFNYRKERPRAQKT